MNAIFLFLGGVHVWEQTIARSGRFHRQQCGVLDISLISDQLGINLHGCTKFTFLLPQTAFSQGGLLSFKLSVNSILGVVIIVPFLLKTTFVRSLKYIFRPFVTVHISLFALQGF